MTEELTVEGELTRDGVDWECEEVGEVERVSEREDEIELRRIEKARVKKVERKNENEKVEKESEKKIEN